MNHRNSAQILALALFGLILISIAPGHSSSIIPQPTDSQDLWQIDLATHRILSPSDFAIRLSELREKYETVLAAPSSKKDDIEEAEMQLLILYQLLHEREKADQIAARMERENLINSYGPLSEYYKLTNNKRMQLRILQRSYEYFKSNAKASPSMISTELVSLGDFYYSAGQMKQADEAYRTAAKEALDTIVEPKQSIQNSSVTNIGQPQETPGFVHIYPLETYACFLAGQGRANEASEYAEEALKYWLSGKYTVLVGEIGGDEISQFLYLLKSKNPAVYNSVLRKFSNLRPESEGFGLIDKYGKELTGPVFHSVSKFSEGLAAAVDKETCKTGYINTKGKWVIKPAYTDGLPFARGLAPVKIFTDDKPLAVFDRDRFFVLVDRTEKIISTLPIKSIEEFDGIAGTGNATNSPSRGLTSHIFDKAGDILFQGRFSSFQSHADATYTAFIETGTKNFGCLGYSLGFPVKFTVEQDPENVGHFRLVQKTIENLPAEERLVEDDYQHFEKLLSPAEQTKKDENQKHDETYPLLNDRNGNPKYVKVKPFSEERAVVQRGKLWGIVDANGREIVPPKYAEITDFQNGIAVYKKVAPKTAN